MDAPPGRPAGAVRRPRGGAAVFAAHARNAVPAAAQHGAPVGSAALPGGFWLVTVVEAGIVGTPCPVVGRLLRA